ncbi:hypothetical protein PflCFBP13510_12560 [Pseudomonas fluorescens]|nr:hypothetical protein PflCFBP13510_12560 [Pseudomonas fluorescens]
MTPVQKLAAALLLVAVLLGAGSAVGVWLTVGYYRPLLDTVNTDLATTRSARDNLEALAGEQGRKLGELVQAGKDREQAAALAQEKAAQEAQPDYSTAQKLLRERTGGDPAQAASAVIDQELGL